MAWKPTSEKVDEETIWRDFASMPDDPTEEDLISIGAWFRKNSSLMRAGAERLEDLVKSQPGGEEAVARYHKMAPIWIEWEEELCEQTDRGAAIVGTALVAEELKALLMMRMTNRSKQVLGMFEPDGPLGTFGAQIKLAYGLAFITHNIFCDLERIRDIRNRFAHRTHTKEKKKDDIEKRVTFDHQEIKNWALTLKCPILLKEETAWRLTDGKANKVNVCSNPRYRFEFTCEHLKTLFAQGQNRNVRVPLNY
jgi:hypothetical protein